MDMAVSHSPFPPALTLTVTIWGQDVSVTSAWNPSQLLILWNKTCFSFKMDVLLGQITHHISTPQCKWSHVIWWQVVKVGDTALSTQERQGHTNGWWAPSEIQWLHRLIEGAPSLLGVSNFGTWTCGTRRSDPALALSLVWPLVKLLKGDKDNTCDISWRGGCEEPVS